MTPSRAYYAVRAAIKRGDLVPQPCVVCGAEKVHAHHEDYSRPLDVVWLCQRDHNWLHQGRTIEGMREGYANRRRILGEDTQPVEALA